MVSYQVRRIPKDASEDDRAGAYAVRRKVFMDEQGVSEAEEMDGKDNDATHFVIRDADAESAVGTARLRSPESGVAKVERVAVCREYRGEGLGERLMSLIESEARSQGCSRTVLHAQSRVIPFYEALGYKVTSEEFVEADIPHVEMKKSL